MRKIVKMAGHFLPYYATKVHIYHDTLNLFKYTLSLNYLLIIAFPLLMVKQ